MPREVSRVGAYALKRSLGKGAFGYVKLGVQDKTGRKVAVKVRANAGRMQLNGCAPRHGDEDDYARRDTATRPERERLTRRARRGDRYSIEKTCCAWTSKSS